MSCGLLITKRSPATVDRSGVTLCKQGATWCEKGCVIVKQLRVEGYNWQVYGWQTGHYGALRTGITATLFFIFHLILLFFVIFIVSCSGATRLFLDVSCYFKMVTNRRRYASRQAAFMIAKASSPLG
ncbi:hypothetical protein LUD45_10885 [Klebsiella pneumoniae]|nr:hypothetical protein [Klebsiella pneumoniae]